MYQLFNSVVGWFLEVKNVHTFILFCENPIERKQRAISIVHDDTKNCCSAM